MKRTALTSLIAILFHIPLFAQNNDTIPTVQDCLGAIPICQDVYDEPEPYLYSGEGNFFEEIYYADICYTIESNGLWYYFMAQTDGYLRFTITPKNMYDDWDWIVFNLTNAKCEQLGKPGMEEFMVSSNNWGIWDSINGYTGANTDSIPEGAVHSNCNGHGTENGPRWNPDIPVKKGNIYYLYLTNWTGSQNSYIIDFSASSTQIFDDSEPYAKKITNLDSMTCGQKTIKFQFSENIQCSDLTDTSITVMSHRDTLEIRTFRCLECEKGATHGRNFVIEMQEPLMPDNYEIVINDYFSDACENVSDKHSLNFAISDLDIQNFTFKNITCHNYNDGKITIQAQSRNDSLLYSITNGNLWSTSTTYKNLNEGKYQVWVKNTKGCKKYVDSVIIENPLPLEIQSVETNDTILCYGDNTASIEIDAGGGTEPLFYSIDGGSTFQRDNGGFSHLPAGNYEIKIRDAHDCSTNGNQYQFSQPSPVEFSRQVTTDVSCFSRSDGEISVQAQGGSGELKYALQGGNYQESGIFTSLPAGSYLISVVDTNHCEKENEITITQPDKLVLNNLQYTEPLCYNDSNGTVNYIVEGGTPEYSARLFDATLDEIHNKNQLAAGSYRLYISDSHSCETSAQFSLSQPEPLEVSFFTNNVTCNGGNDGMILTYPEGGTKPYTFFWRDEHSGQSRQKLTAGYYGLVLIDNHNCTLDTSVQITEPQVISASIEKHDVSCFGGNDGSIEVSITGGTGEFLFHWSNDSAGSHLTRLDTGIYHVVVTDTVLFECAEAEAEILQPEAPLEIHFPDTVMSCWGDNTGAIKAAITGGTKQYTLYWSNGETTDSINQLTPGNYHLQVIDANGCETGKSIEIISIPCPSYLEIPNVFSPNYDGKNDQFTIRSLYIESIHGEIYNRWGRKIYEWNNTQNGWNGKINGNGKNASEGVYYYVLKAVGLDDKAYHLKGILYLYR